MRARPLERIALTDRFWSKVDKTGRCWNWIGAVTGFGYGRFKLPDGRHVLAHRALFISMVREISPDLLVLHRCDNPRCVNPEHLFVGTHQDNSDDKFAKGRQRFLTKTHCKRGHAFTEENIYLWHRTRICRACRRERGAR